MLPIPAMKIEKLAKKLLDEYLIEFRRFPLTNTAQEGFTNLIPHFDKNGKIFKTTDEMVDNIQRIAKNPLAALDLIYQPKDIAQRSKPTKTKVVRNDICPHCNSGKKFKVCCGK